MSLFGKVVKGMAGGAIGGAPGAAMGTMMGKHKKPAAASPMQKSAKKPTMGQAMAAMKHPTRPGPMDSTPPTPKPKMTLAQKTVDGAKKKGSLIGFSLR